MAEGHFQVAITLFNLARCHGFLGDHQKKAEILPQSLADFFIVTLACAMSTRTKARTELQEANRVR